MLGILQDILQRVNLILLELLDILLLILLRVDNIAHSDTLPHLLTLAENLRLLGINTKLSNKGLFRHRSHQPEEIVPCQIILGQLKKLTRVSITPNKVPIEIQQGISKSLIDVLLGPTIYIKYLIKFAVYYRTLRRRESILGASLPL